MPSNINNNTPTEIEPKKPNFRKTKIIGIFSGILAIFCLIVYIDKYLENFPKKDIEIKNRIKSTSYDILEEAYKANNIEKNKSEHIENIIAKIKVIDFLLNLCYDKQIINQKRYVKFGEKMDDILKYCIGWKKSINT